MKRIIMLISIMLVFISCKKEEEDLSYINEVNDWHGNRINSLKKPDGWLSLVGLHWLKEGENRFGSDESNDILFINKAPSFIGSFYLKDSVVTVKIKKGLDVFLDSIKIEEAVLENDITGKPSILKYGTLSWYVIKRAGNKYGIRVKDSENDLLKSFDGIERYPVSKKWRVEAKYIPYDPPKRIIIPNVTGVPEEELSPGKILFKINGKEFSLDPTDAGKRFFLTFADLTNGEETYGAGRFLYIDKPDTAGMVYIDFNKAYNPPCAFTKFATCPLPPKDNMLKIAVEAGEKNFGESYH
ncbi:MAG: DUF1684 domain-containing protein [Melioribacteraceae bacterium]|nr:DUF1684 domain-containing protein [Melioribacteraceae bacterium]